MRKNDYKSTTQEAIPYWFSSSRNHKTEVLKQEIQTNTKYEKNFIKLKLLSTSGDERAAGGSNSGLSWKMASISI